jgi:hypothetical protein
MVLVPNAVTISGEKDASIEVGTIPFYVEAPGDSVTIQGLRFCNPTAKAIVVYAANGVMGEDRLQGFELVHQRTLDHCIVLREHTAHVLYSVRRHRVVSGE